MTVLQGDSHHGCGTMAVPGGGAAGCCKAATGHGERRAMTASTTTEVPRGCGDASISVATLGAELRSKGGRRCYESMTTRRWLRCYEAGLVISQLYFLDCSDLHRQAVLPRSSDVRLM